MNLQCASRISRTARMKRRRIVMTMTQKAVWRSMHETLIAINPVSFAMLHLRRLIESSVVVVRDNEVE